MITSFEDLLVWRKADELAHKVFDVSETFPSKYEFDLTNPLRKSALSIPSSIAEGWASIHAKESLQYLNICKRSLGETRYLLLFARKRNLIDEEEFTEFNEGYKEANKMLNGLIKSIRNKPYKLKANTNQ